VSAETCVYSPLLRTMAWRSASRRARCAIDELEKVSPANRLAPRPSGQPVAMAKVHLVDHGRPEDHAGSCDAAAESDVATIRACLARCSRRVGDTIRGRNERRWPPAIVTEERAWWVARHRAVDRAGLSPHRLQASSEQSPRIGPTCCGHESSPKCEAGAQKSSSGRGAAASCPNIWRKDGSQTPIRAGRDRGRGY